MLKMSIRYIRIYIFTVYLDNSVDCQAAFAFRGHDTGDIGAGVLFVVYGATINLYCSKFSPVKKTKGLPFF